MGHWTMHGHGPHRGLGECFDALPTVPIPVVPMVGIAMFCCGVMMGVMVGMKRSVMMGGMSHSMHGSKMMGGMGVKPGLGDMRHHHHGYGAPACHCPMRGEAMRLEGEEGQPTPSEPGPDVVDE